MQEQFVSYREMRANRTKESLHSQHENRGEEPVEEGESVLNYGYQEEAGLTSR